MGQPSDDELEQWVKDWPVVDLPAPDMEWVFERAAFVTAGNRWKNWQIHFRYQWKAERREWLEKKNSAKPEVRMGALPVESATARRIRLEGELRMVREELANSMVACGAPSAEDWAHYRELREREKKIKAEIMSAGGNN